MLKCEEYQFCLYFAGLVSFVFLLLIVGCSARAPYPLPIRRSDGKKQPLQTFRAYNVAHRGSSGVIPEETTAAYIVCFSVIMFQTFNSSYCLLEYNVFLKILVNVDCLINFAESY